MNTEQQRKEFEEWLATVKYDNSNILSPSNLAWEAWQAAREQVTEQRDEALSDLEFRRDLFKLQEQQINDVRAQRDELLRYNEAFRKETLICADCDAIRKEEYDQAIEQRDRLAEAMQKLRNNESMSLGGAAYEIVEQALQSLTTNEL
jgi:hypothetical protein